MVNIIDLINAQNSIRKFIYNLIQYPVACLDKIIIVLNLFYINR